MRLQEVVVLSSFLIVVGGLLLGAFVVHLSLRQQREERQLVHRERMAAIEKGLDVPLLDVLERKRRRSPLQSALLMLASGIALSVPLLGEGPRTWMWGFWLALLGLAMLVHWFARGRKEWERDRALDEELRKAYVDRLRSGAPLTTLERQTAS